MTNTIGHTCHWHNFLTRPNTALCAQGKVRDMIKKCCHCKREDLEISEVGFQFLPSWLDVPTPKWNEGSGYGVGRPN